MTQYPCQGSYIAIQCQPIAIQTIQLHTQGCNTNFLSQYNWAVAQINFLHLYIFFFSFFIFFFPLFPATGKCPKKYIYTFFFLTHAIGKIPKNISILFFFFISSNYWKIHKKNIPIYYYYFFNFLEYSNKIIKIDFIQFSSILQLVKP